MGIILTEIARIWESMKEPFHFLGDPINIVVKIEPYNSASSLILEKIKNKIHILDPNLPVHFIGSTPLKISGRKDIDLFIECPSTKFKKYISGINFIFGKCSRNRRKYIEWKTNYCGWEIDALLIDPNEKKFKDQMLTFMILKNNQQLRHEYEGLKKSLDGVSLMKYEQVKRRFFAKLIKESVDA